MFEKDADIILSSHCDCELLPECLQGIRSRCSDYEEMKKLLLEGIEFGYQKANEWHDLRKNPNDLPDEDVYVYLWFRGQEYPTVARRHLFKEWGRLKWCWDCKWGSGYTVEADNDRIIAWQEIIPPKETK